MTDANRTFLEARSAPARKPLNWPSLQLPPINLWNAPTQSLQPAATPQHNPWSPAPAATATALTTSHKEITNG